MKRITILLAEDHTIVREGFRTMLEMEHDFEVVGEAEDGRQALILTRKLRPEVVLMDIAMPRLNGVEATCQVLRDFPATKVIILSAHSDDAYISEAIESGAAGFLLKQSSAHMVCEAIREVHKGNSFFSPAVASRLGKGKPQFVGRSRRSKPGVPMLTGREKEVLQLIAEGRSNKQVAGDLGICTKTVEKHRANVMSKLDIHDTAGLTRYAIGAGIIENSAQATII